MSTGAFEAEDDEHPLCPQCYGKGWVTIHGRKLRCTCAVTWAVAARAADG